MKKIGLALSGGGFRASLYHLGLVRFLRDAGILSQVTHITSVCGRVDLDGELWRAVLSTTGLPAGFC